MRWVGVVWWGCEIAEVLFKVDDFKVQVLECVSTSVLEIPCSTLGSGFFQQGSSNFQVDVCLYAEQQRLSRPFDWFWICRPFEGNLLVRAYLAMTFRRCWLYIACHGVDRDVECFASMSSTATG